MAVAKISKILPPEIDRINIQMIGGTRAEQRHFREHFEIIEYHLGGIIYFNFNRNATGDWRINFNGISNSSYKGLDMFRVDREFNMQFRSFHETGRIVMHESLHALGLEHEMVGIYFKNGRKFYRDRDPYATWKQDEYIYIGPPSNAAADGSNYDLRTVMMYHQREEDLFPGFENYAQIRNYRLSIYDVLFLQQYQQLREEINNPVTWE